MDPDLRQFLRRADRLADKMGLTRSSLSALLFNDGKKLDRLARGGDVYFTVFKRARADLARLEKQAGINR